ncbi:MAG: hypothetical protein COW58_00125 [Thalassolituus sp. CG17_big_fil_post_rev_8_21_14_2_50_53_8]|nr:MAG: hypothetical protein COW58_00125 [Thalassolituus sp. CG17_big_fil_post_rev_8_21_14_2_50_53_8]
MAKMPVSATAELLNRGRSAKQVWVLRWAPVLCGQYTVAKNKGADTNPPAGRRLLSARPETARLWREVWLLLPDGLGVPIKIDELFRFG